MIMMKSLAAQRNVNDARRTKAPIECNFFQAKVNLLPKPMRENIKLDLKLEF